MGASSIHLPHGDRSQLALAKPGQHQRLVDQGPFLPEPFQPALHFRAQLGVRLRLFACPGRRSCVQQRPAACHVQEPHQFGFGQCPAFPAAVGLFVGLRHFGKRIRQKTRRPGFDAPIAERHPCPAIRVAGCRPPCPRLLRSSKPAFQGGRVQVGQPTKATIGGNPVQLRTGVVHPAGNALRLLVVNEGGDMIGKRRALVVDYGVFGGGQALRP